MSFFGEKDEYREDKTEQLRKLKDDVEKLRGENEELRYKVKHQVDEIQTLRNDSVDVIRQLSVQFRDAEVVRSSMNFATEELKKREEELKSSRDDATSKLLELAQNLGSLRTENQKCEEELTRLIGEKRKLVESAKEDNHESNNLRTQLTRMVRDKELCEDELRSVSDELKNVKEEANDLRNQVADKECEKLTECFECLSKNNAELTKLIETVNRQNKAIGRLRGTLIVQVIVMFLVAAMLSYVRREV